MSDILKNKLMLLECQETLIKSCLSVGGIVPDQKMTLQDFILTYGWNGVIFSVSKLVNKGEHNDKSNL
jgi:hypothetical protein